VRASGLPAIFVFIAPPSLEELERRLRSRRTEGAPELQRRLGAAKGEIESLNERGLYDYLLINDKLEETKLQLVRIAARAAQVGGCCWGAAGVSDCNWKWDCMQPSRIQLLPTDQEARCKTHSHTKQGLDAEPGMVPEKVILEDEVRAARCWVSDLNLDLVLSL